MAIETLERAIQLPSVCKKDVCFAKSSCWEVRLFDIYLQKNKTMENSVGFMDKPVRDCSHIYSDGRNVPVLFETDADKIDGRNLIAVTALETGVVILMDIVMSTHFHSVAAGTDRCRAKFSDEMKRKLALRVSRLGIKLGGDGELHVRKDDIKTENELKTKIMYHYRNAISAGYGMMPWHYPGGPGDIFFSDHSDKG